MYRQGDLLIVAEPIPQRVNKDNTQVVQLGEATGHAHELVGGDLFGNATWLRVPEKGADLVHPEHDTITLPEGEYRVYRQREHLGENQWDVISD